MSGTGILSILTELNHLILSMILWDTLFFRHEARKTETKSHWVTCSVTKVVLNLGTMAL